jgi:hypothetical protein
MNFVPRLVHGTTAVEHNRRFEGPLPCTRPGDRVEPWPVRDDVLRAIAAAARSCRLPTETAAVLVVERALLADDDLAVGNVDASVLDAAAATARVVLALSEPQSAYLATLRGGRTSNDASLPRLIPIPMRLTERISGDVERLVRPELLGSALAWEQAAVLAGRTMAEWALRAALHHDSLPASASA